MAQDVLRHIEEHLNESIAQLVELCRLPTVSAQDSAIGETAEYVVGRLEALGFETCVLPKRPADFLRRPSNRQTLLIRRNSERRS